MAKEHPKTRVTQGRQATSSRRWLRFGPGLLLAIVASAVVWWRMPPGASGGGDRPPRIARSQMEAFPASPPSAPEPAWLLSQRDALRLSASQVKRLEQLRARWERDTRALRGQLVRASDEFHHSMSDKGGHVTIQQLQERAAPVSNLSRQLADTRRAWWDEASKTLTAPQRQRAEEAWKRRFALKEKHR